MQVIKLTPKAYRCLEERFDINPLPHAVPVSPSPSPALSRVNSAANMPRVPSDKTLQRSGAATTTTQPGMKKAASGGSLASISDVLSPALASSHPTTIGLYTPGGSPVKGLLSPTPSASASTSYSAGAVVEEKSPVVLHLPTAAAGSAPASKVDGTTAKPAEAAPLVADSVTAGPSRVSESTQPAKASTSAKKKSARKRGGR